jgi:hypothetical protein
MHRNIYDAPLGGADRDSRSAHHQRLETSTVGPLGGADGESRSGHDQRLETSTMGPLGGGVREYGSAYHQRLETSMAARWEVLTENPAAPTINA